MCEIGQTRTLKAVRAITSNIIEILRKALGWGLLHLTINFKHLNKLTVDNSTINSDLSDCIMNNMKYR